MASLWKMMESGRQQSHAYKEGKKTKCRQPRILDPVKRSFKNQTQIIVLRHTKAGSEFMKLFVEGK